MAFNLKRKRGHETLAGSEKKQPIVIHVDDQDSGLELNGIAVQEDRRSPKLTDPEEEEWVGVGVEPVSTTEHETDRIAGKGAKKPPTGEELRGIKDAADLYRSNSFKLQIDQLLPNVRPKSSRIPPLDRVLLTLHTLIMTLSPAPPQHPLEAARSLLKKGIAVPYSLPLPTEDTNWKVSFEKPIDITLVGSWANKISVKAQDGGRFGVDLAVEMPTNLFQEKDYLNGRYFHKRAFYMATIAAAIRSKNSGLNVDILYDSPGSDTRLTTLVLRPRKDGSADDFTKLNAQIRIIPVLSAPSPIPIHRLSPSHSNIRISSSSESQFHPPTPLYNTALLLSFTPKASLLSTHALKQTSPAFGDALTLLRVWANQRGYGEGSRMCISGFEGRGNWWAGVLELLIVGEESAARIIGKQRKPVGQRLSSYQFFRAALDFLAKHNFEKNTVFLKTKNGHQFQIEEYTEHHEAVFVDGTSLINLLSGVPLSSIDMLKYDAVKTLEMLDRSSISQDPFAEVFLKEQRDLSARFDTIIRVDLADAKVLNPALHIILDYGSQNNAILAQMSKVLRRGLGNRTKAVAILHPSCEVRSISQAHPSNSSIVYIGLIYEHEHSTRLVDHGPAADGPDPSLAEQFRNFWGEKAELRRFKDGRIIESVVWDVKTSDERAHVPSMVVRYLLGRHLGLEEKAVQTWQTSFDALLRLPENVARFHQASAGFKGAMMAFDRLVKSLKSLDEQLPLSLTNVSPASEYLRQTSVFSPVPLSSASAALMPECLRYLPTMDIILEFEKSSKWPDNLRAIQKIKLAFFERIASALMHSIDGVNASVVFGDDVECPDIQDQSRLIIKTVDGWAFSARIWHDREATLLDRILSDTSRPPNHLLDSDKGYELHEALEAKEIYSRRFIHAPRHHRIIASLCHRFSAYAGTVRLVKRWLGSHWLLHGHISEEVVEIICAYFFVGEGGSGALSDDRPAVPRTRERGFAAVIDFLRGWQWEQGLQVPLYGRREYGAVSDSSKLGSSKHNAWMVATEADASGYVWTSSGPDAMVACRVRDIAQATWKCLNGMDKGMFDVKALFIHPIDDYDFVIHLDAAVLPRYCQNIVSDTAFWSHRGHYTNIPKENGNLTLRPGYDPAQLLFDDLTRIYKGTAKFFFDPFGGDKIGAVWEPNIKLERPFRVLNWFSSIPSSKEKARGKDKKGLVGLNDAAVLSEIGRLASGALKNVVINA